MLAHQPQWRPKTKANSPGGIVMQRLTHFAFVSVFALFAPAFCLGSIATPAIAAESNEFHIARQPGLVYLQAILMEEKKLVEKHAAALGLADIKVKYSIITSGGVMTEA